MRYEYEFDFGPNPSFIVDGWFMKVIGKVFLLCVVLFSLAAFTSHVFTRVVIPAINEIGAGLIKWGFKGKLIPLKTFIMLQSNEIGLLPLPADTPADVLALVEEKLVAR